MGGGGGGVGEEEEGSSSVGVAAALELGPLDVEVARVATVVRM